MKGGWGSCVCVGEDMRRGGSCVCGGEGSCEGGDLRGGGGGEDIGHERGRLVVRGE